LQADVYRRHYTSAAGRHAVQSTRKWPYGEREANRGDARPAPFGLPPFCGCRTRAGEVRCGCGIPDVLRCPSVGGRHHTHLV